MKSHVSTFFIPNVVVGDKLQEKTIMRFSIRKLNKLANNLTEEEKENAIKWIEECENALKRFKESI